MTPIDLLEANGNIEKKLREEFEETIRGGYLLSTLGGTSASSGLPAFGESVAFLGNWTCTGSVVVFQRGGVGPFQGNVVVAGLPSGAAHPTVSSADQVRDLRDLSGLTWDQLARLFGVSRRAVHFWASGGRMNASNSELLAELLDVVSRLSAVSPEGVRAELLAPQSGGLSLFDQIRSRHASRPSDVNSGGWQPAHVGALRGQAQE